MLRISAYLFLLSITAASPMLAVSQDAATATKPTGKTTTLFGGGDLSGWVGREDLWSVEDGQIVGRTSDKDPIEANTFLIWKGELPKNFELTLLFKIESGNSGIQYRSKVLDEKAFVVGGYQADIDFANTYAGILYEEKGRGILAKRGESVSIDEKGKKARKRFGDETALGKGIHPGKWNEFRIVADGNRLQHYINGAMTAEVIDNQPDKSSNDGVIALQLHRGPAMVVRFKNIVIRSLK